MKKYVFIVSLFISAVFFAQIPAGYYNNAQGLTGASLKTALSGIITNGHTDNGYAGLYDAYETTDRDYFYENDGTILDMYSENPSSTDPYNFTYNTNECGNYSAEGDCYNREHIVPQSLFSDASPMRNDVHSVRPTDGKVNGIRSNYPYGEVTSADYTSQNGSKKGNSTSVGYSGLVFEPIDEFKGDIARMVFYFITRYESNLSSFNTGDMLGGSTYPGLQTWELNQLLIWNAQDPVSNVEIARNNASYSYQGNRNPYIDHPEYVNQVWGDTDTQNPTAPTNVMVTNTTSNSIALSWNAATDNIGVVTYDVYVDGVFYGTFTGTTATITGLSNSTTYDFYVVAKDLAGNQSSASNTVTGTTLAGTAGGSCGTEDFTNIPANASSYGTHTWTSNNITWTATDARTDQTINSRAITVRSGSLTSSSVTGGITSLTVSTQRKFSGSTGTFNVLINGTLVGTVPYDDTVQTTTLSNLNITGNIVIQLTNNGSDRVALDDVSWTCNTLALEEIQTNNASFTIYPNPVKNGVIYVEQFQNAPYHIYSLEGQEVQEGTSEGKKIAIPNLPKGIYLIEMNKQFQKFIVE